MRVNAELSTVVYLAREARGNWRRSNVSICYGCVGHADPVSRERQRTLIRLRAQDLRPFSLCGCAAAAMDEEAYVPDRTD